MTGAARRHLRAALVAVRRENRALDARIAAQVPQIEAIADRGQSAEARSLARRWMALSRN